jgi:predicted GIY-YIG superfamily endonuclease
MAGLVPAIHAFAAPVASRTVAQMRGGSVYIMTNRPSGRLYTGATADIALRAYEHRKGLSGGFTKRYELTRLVWYDQPDAAHKSEATIAPTPTSRLKDVEITLRPLNRQDSYTVSLYAIANRLNSN